MDILGTVLGTLIGAFIWSKLFVWIASKVTDKKSSIYVGYVVAAAFVLVIAFFSNAIHMFVQYLPAFVLWLFVDLYRYKKKATLSEQNIEA